MIRNALTFVAFVGMLFGQQYSAEAQNDVLHGSFSFSTQGQAQLLNDSGCSAKGAVVASLVDGNVFFDGFGRITRGNVGISIGTTYCTSPNYAVTGTYTVTDSDASGFRATGVFTMSFQGRLAACSGTFLVNQPFSIIKTAGEPTRIQTSGAGDGGPYTEGFGGSISTTCKGATIANFVTTGTGIHTPATGP